MPLKPNHERLRAFRLEKGLSIKAIVVSGRLSGISMSGTRIREWELGIKPAPYSNEDFLYYATQIGLSQKVIMGIKKESDKWNKEKSIQEKTKNHINFY